MRNLDATSPDTYAGTELDSVDPIMDLAKAILAQNRKRNRFLPQLEWGEPGWELLLDLFVSENENLGTSDMAIARRNNIPLSSARRYLALMVERGLLETTSPTELGNGSSLRLTKTAKHGLVSWIRNCWGSLQR